MTSNTSLEKTIVWSSAEGAVPWPASLCDRIGVKPAVALVQLVSAAAATRRDQLRFEDVFTLDSLKDRDANDRHVFTAPGARAVLRKLAREAATGELGQPIGDVMAAISLTKTDVIIRRDELLAAWRSLSTVPSPDGGRTGAVTGHGHAEGAAEADEATVVREARAAKAGKAQKRVGRKLEQTFPDFALHVVAKNGVYRVEKEERSTAANLCVSGVYPHLASYATISDGCAALAVARNHLHEWLEAAYPKVAHMVCGDDAPSAAWALFCEWLRRRSGLYDGTSAGRDPWMLTDVWSAGLCQGFADATGKWPFYRITDSKETHQFARQHANNAARRFSLKSPCLDREPNNLFTTARRWVRIGDAMLAAARVEIDMDQRRSFLMSGTWPKGSDNSVRGLYSLCGSISEKQGLFVENWDQFCTADGSLDIDQVRDRMTHVYILPQEKQPSTPSRDAQA